MLYSPPSQVDISISPELPKEHSPHGVVGACSNTECSGPALRSCSTSSSDVSPAKKLFPVFQRGLASSQDALGSKKLSRKLKTSRRVSRVAASLEKQSLLLQFYDKELKNSDAEWLWCFACVCTTFHHNVQLSTIGNSMWRYNCPHLLCVQLSTLIWFYVSFWILLSVLHQPRTNELMRCMF